VSSQTDRDHFNFYVDGELVLSASGNPGWLPFETTLPVGTQEVEWEYVKDASGTGFSDAVFLDDIEVAVDAASWVDVIALTDVGASAAEWTPAEVSETCKARVRSYVGGGEYSRWDESDGMFAVIDQQFAAGDLNCDGAVDGFDIDAFVLALADAAGYAAAHPGCDRALADINGDGAVDGFDIDPFVLLLTGK
jgi:hypothetical protein